MENLENLFEKAESLKFSGDQKCIELLDNLLQDIMESVTSCNLKMSPAIIELKGCSWVLHERYHMDTYDQLKWTFHHCKHRITKAGNDLIKRQGLALAS